ncbi:hypothetical protein BP5796_03762 [Coleophoma crateriformis]|uniref:Uncharacterized protein n=1 Tax=Coleophoma crateriformis TaxID=565419 RepID=A0A3D8SGF9_9HELO|nr:hypothetical protein BP5796_03762 [Coleophoma crateriformis]
MKPTYCDFVKDQVERNPCLSGLANFLSTCPYSPADNRNVHCHDYTLEGSLESIDRNMEFEECLAGIACAIKEPAQTRLRRIVFVEDISPHCVEQLGTLLDIDPMFFSNYINTSFSGFDKAPPPPPLSLFPSRLTSKDSLHLHYQRVLRLNFSTGVLKDLYDFKSSGNVPRSVRCLASLSGTRPGLARSCCSILLKILNRKSWICLVLMDSTSADLLVPTSSTSDTILSHERIPQVPFQGGFEDFEEPRKFSEYCLPTNLDNVTQKNSLHQRILHYYRNPPPNFDPANPSMLALSYYPLKVVAAEWMAYVLLMNSCIKFYEYSFRQFEHRSIEADITDLQRWRRRGKQSLLKLQAVELFIDKHLALQSTSPHLNNNVSLVNDNNNPYATLQEDYRYLSTQIEQYSRSLESILPLAATIVQLTDARRSISEAVNVRYLTYIAMVFVPLTFVSSLFSMSNGFVPGQAKFWVYMAVAAPLMVVVLSFALITSINIRSWWRATRDRLTSNW